MTIDDRFSHGHLLALPVAFVKLDTVDLCHYLDTEWRHTDLQECPRGEKLGFVNRGACKCFDRFSDTGRILGMDGDPDVQILGIPDVAVEPHRVPANEQVVNFVGVQ